MKRSILLWSLGLSAALSACGDSKSTETDESMDDSPSPSTTTDASSSSPSSTPSSPSSSSPSPSSSTPSPDPDEPADPDDTDDTDDSDDSDAGSPFDPPSEPEENDEECPAAAPADGDACEAGGGFGGGLECTYGDQLCECGGGFGGGEASWSCAEAPVCPAEAPVDGESCMGLNGLECGDCECSGFGGGFGGGGGGGPTWSCGEDDPPDFGDEDGGAPTFPTDPEPSADGGSGEPADPGNPMFCPDTAPADETPCTGGGFGGGGGGGGGGECSYGGETLVCTCEGGGFGGGGGGGDSMWSCEAPDEEEEPAECPEAPEDGESCDGFQGETCGECDCSGFGNPSWDCGGTEDDDPSDQDGGADFTPFGD